MTETMVLEEIIRLVEGMLPENAMQHMETPLADAKIVDLPLDSLDLLELAFQLEDKLNIAIQTDVINQEATLRHLASRLASMRE